MSVVARFEIELTRFLDAKGKPHGSLPAFADDEKLLTEMYRTMVLTRTFDAKAIALQRTGKMGTFASTLGQEAVSVAVGSAMRPEDVFLPYYRDYGAQFWRGVAMDEILAYWGGDERGSNFAGPREDFPISVPIGTQTLHAAGVATAFKLRKEPRVAVCTLGDGATSKGDFYEAMNVAGVWKLPVVFVIINNQWAISIPRAQQTAAETLAQKAVAAGISGHQVDGNDVLAMRSVVLDAVEKARSGGGASVVEALTYRLSDHTTADDATRYRSAEEVKEAWAVEPILRFRSFLADRGFWDKNKEDALAKECAERVNAAVDRYLGAESPKPEAMFEHLYAELPPVLVKQQNAAKGEGGHA